MVTMETMENHLATYELKNQEYLLEFSLKRADMKGALDELGKIAKQLSIGPFVFESQFDGFRVSVIDSRAHMHIGAASDRTGGEETFLEDLASVLDNCIVQARSDKPEVIRAYANLVLQIAKDNNVYDRAKKIYEQYYAARRASDEVRKNFKDWYGGVWGDMYDIAKTWYEDINNIKPGTKLVLINQKNYTTRVKVVRKVTNIKKLIRVTFKDSSYIYHPSFRVAKAETWVLAHPEYEPLLKYLRDTEDKMMENEKSSGYFSTSLKYN